MGSDFMSGTRLIGNIASNSKLNLQKYVLNNTRESQQMIYLFKIATSFPVEQFYFVLVAELGSYYFPGLDIHHFSFVYFQSLPFFPHRTENKT